MRNGGRTALLVLAAVFCMVVPAGGLALAQGTVEDVVPVEREWAVFIYCGADNDYEEATEFSLEQCSKGLSAEGSDPDRVYVVALLDKKGPDGTWVYEVTAGDPQVPVSGWSDNERNSSDPATLDEFLDFVTPRFPAENTLLVVKNGHAWCGVCPDETEEDEKYLMPIDGLAAATEGRGIDIIALEGDNMASIEGAYELRHSTRYFVGTQQDMPLDGLPYYLMMKDIAGDEITPPALAEAIVRDYVYYYNNTDGKKNTLDHLLSNSQMAVTASAFDLGTMDEQGAYRGEKIEALVGSFTDLIEYMMYGMLPEHMGGGLAYDEGEEWNWVPENRNNIASARDCALIGKMGDQAGYEWLPDVRTWFWILESLVNYYEEVDELLPVLVEAFNETYDATRLAMEQCQILDRSGNSFPHGLNFWFPPTWTLWESLDYTRERTYLYDGSNVPLPAEYYCVDCPLGYDEVELDFVDDTPWMDFFELYYDSRWVVYGNPDAPRETPLWEEG